ncbi:saccharopine dehydrogenase-like oxidoreductase [Atractiella rhizophila]|nr:saccharopine dehydrogenase-like oxidoreductase [Atractiella rhizophila]
MSLNQNILVLGAGELGSAILKSLLSRKPSAAIKLSVLLRPTSTTSIPSEVSIVREDISTASQSALASVFSPFDTIISCTGFVGGPGIQLKLAKSVLEAGVPRYFPWQFGVDYDVIGRGSPQDLFDEQLDVRDLLRSQSRTEWVIVSTGMFTSFLFEPAFGIVDFEKKVVRALGSWENGVTVTTPEDIGKITAEVVFEEPRVRNTVVYTSGDTILYHRLAEMLEQESGNWEKEEWTVDWLMEELRKDSGNQMKKYRAVFALGRGVSWEKEQTYNVKRGISVMDTKEWLRKNTKEH